MNFSQGYDPDKAPDYRLVMRHPAVKRLALAEDLALPEAAALILALLAPEPKTALQERVLTRHAARLAQPLLEQVLGEVRA